MSQNLTQPEEIDHILSTMDIHDQAPGATADKSASQGKPLKNTARNTSPCKSSPTGDFSCTPDKTKHAHGFGESYPYVWSM